MSSMVPPADISIPEVVEMMRAIFAARGLQAVNVSNAEPVEKWIRLDVSGAFTKWTIEVEKTPSLFGKLPVVRLVSPLKLLAHVSHYRHICIDDGQGLSIAEDLPLQVIANVACDAFAVLEAAEKEADSGMASLFDEFEGYWDTLPYGQTARSAIEVDGGSRALYGHVENLGKGQLTCWYFTERGGAQPSEFHTSRLASFSALYLTLDKGVFPPPPGCDLDKAFVQRVLNALSVADKKLWTDTIGRRWKGQKRLCPVLVSMPRPSGGHSLFGITFTLRNGEVDGKAPIRPLTIRRHTPNYMRERGGASASLAESHVAIFGCGSIGSEVADTLASCGVGKFTLVDTDEMGVENVFRHALGKGDIGQKKVVALKAELLRKYPGLTINVSTDSAHHWLATEAAKSANVAVIAIGAPASDRELANQIRSLALRCGVTVTWLEAYGLGGHVLSLPPNGGGCIECVYRSDDGTPSLHPYVSFLAPGQKVSKSMSGCLGTFIPYTALHSRRTALLAAEGVLGQLNGNSAPNYAYWVGTDQMALQAGAETSPWFKRAKSVDQDVASRTVFSHQCSHCGRSE